MTGRENLGAVAFFRRINELVHGTYLGLIVAAEESTSWPLVSRPTYLGGLGFVFKWNMGRMHDVLDYMSLDARRSLRPGSSPDGQSRAGCRTPRSSQ